MLNSRTQINLHLPFHHQVIYSDTCPSELAGRYQFAVIPIHSRSKIFNVVCVLQMCIRLAVW